MYFDSSAILCWFFGEQGSEEMNILYKNRTNFVGRIVSPIVDKEVKQRISQEGKNPQSPYTKKQLDLAFKKLEYFIIIKPKGQEPDAKNYKSELLKRYSLKERDENDADIISHLIYLNGYVYESRPLVVSCDKKMCEVASGEGFKCFNPRVQKFTSSLFK